jgi:hypothetical protein
MRFLFALGALLTMSLSGVTALTLFPSSGVRFPADESLIQQVQQRCPSGKYFCPGKISGCCPIGWGCGSTRCIPPKRKPVQYGNCYWDGTGPFCAGRCRPGFVVQLRRTVAAGCVTGSQVYCCEPMGSITQH